MFPYDDCQDFQAKIDGRNTNFEYSLCKSLLPKRYREDRRLTPNIYMEHTWAAAVGGGVAWPLLGGPGDGKGGRGGVIPSISAGCGLRCPGNIDAGGGGGGGPENQWKRSVTPVHIAGKGWGGGNDWQLGWEVTGKKGNWNMGEIAISNNDNCLENNWGIR